MKTKLHKLVFLSALTIVGMQGANAQDYKGIPFGGTATKIGVTLGVGDKLQMENFDRLPSNVDGANYVGDTANPIDPTPAEAATYYEVNTSTEGEANLEYRTGSTVDLKSIIYPDTSVGYVLTSIVGQEFQMYTVEVMQSGSYTATVNYKNTSTAKQFQVFLYPTTATAFPPNSTNGTKILINTNTAGTSTPALTGTGGAFMNSASTNPFDLTAGTYFLRTRELSTGGYEIDYITFTLNATLSTEDLQLEANTLKAYPNPAQGGQFNLNIESDWQVYSLLGAKVLEGKGKNVDLSSFAKGTYILKTENSSIKLISE